MEDPLPHLSLRRKTHKERSYPEQAFNTRTHSTLRAVCGSRTLCSLLAAVFPRQIHKSPQTNKNVLHCLATLASSPFCAPPSASIGAGSFAVHAASAKRAHGRRVVPTAADKTHLLHFQQHAPLSPAGAHCIRVSSAGVCTQSMRHVTQKVSNRKSNVHSDIRNACVQTPTHQQHTHTYSQFTFHKSCPVHWW